ncbi:MAG: CBS domain-containing protein [Pseudolabrys sp.]|nr:CBS domain-containing protein [Pseudolabrys sp.]
MQVKDVMTHPVITIAPDASIWEAIRLMLQHKISGLPVVDRSGTLTGIVTEGDFLRRTETGTVRRRPRWIEFLVGPGKLAQEYVHASGRKLEEVMTTEVYSVSEEAPLNEVVSLMERHRIKRLPVVRGQRVVGIITRADLLRALMKAAKPSAPVSTDDATIRRQLLSQLEQQNWAPAGTIDVTVKGGVVTLSGVITDERERQALCVVAENIPGVKKVEDQLAWVVPGSGVIGEPVTVIGPPGQG